ncbi:MAG: AAA family ATPase [Gammaproteobacteria bacterium]|nr:AAA family ATPase [Gammaproteobacteria bacterium]
MYEDYFGLKRPPFKITPDTSLFYEGGKRGDILAALVYAIHRGEGIIKVVGEVGSGKTMLCRMLQIKLPDTVEIVYIANPSVSSEDILFVIAHELSLPVTRDSSKHEVMHLLQDYLLQRHMENKQVVLFIEEAQGMPLDTLEEIRLLSNLETDQNKLLQIILFGQPELDQNLSQQSIRQLRERITHNFDLEPLTQDEIHTYLNFRMREVGYTGPELINPTVAKKVELHSDGLLRRINIIADKILLSAFAEGTHNLSAKHVTAAVNDSAFNQKAPRKSRALWWLGILLIIALAFALYETRSQWISVKIADIWSSIQASDLTPKHENAVKNVNPITDITPQALETDENKVPVMANTEPEMSPAPVQSETVVEEIQIPASLKQELTALGEQESEALEKQVEEVLVSANVTSEKQESEALEKQVEEVVVPVNVTLNQLTEKTPLESAPAQLAEDEVLQSALDQAASTDALETGNSNDLGLTEDYNQWLNAKLRESRNWLSNANRDNVSIQVLMRSKSAARELVYYLRNEWPLDLSETYLYEVNTDTRSIYRVFYSEFNSLSNGRNQLQRLPESVKKNSPYLHSVYRMQKALL